MAQGLESDEVAVSAPAGEAAAAATSNAHLASAESPAATERVTLLTQPEKSYPKRFRVALLVVGILAGAAIAGFVVLLPNGTKTRTIVPVAWSKWRPVCATTLACDPPHQIGRYVQRRYFLSSGQQAVTVFSGGVVIPSQATGGSEDVPTIVERHDKGARLFYTGNTLGYEIQRALGNPVVYDNTVQYNLCGLNPDCKLAGKTSRARGNLIRRETLELALYTFKYYDGVQSVLAFLPSPLSTTASSFAFFFHRADYQRELSQPLSKLLPDHNKLTPDGVPEAEAEAVRRLTSKSAFTFTYQRSQIGYPILVLTPEGY